ncbi:DUF5829 family protein [Luteimonas saliphila]|uniref:DUF5829 family protein n=1 Tax=Luteimonas saliphila TaxID=2804919 RepID=UPI00192E2442
MKRRRPSSASLLAVACLGIGLLSPTWAEREPTADASGGAAEALPRPALNHLYVVLDAETFAALRDSPWVERALARPDAGLPHFQQPTDDSDRLFLRGRNTYLEFFAPGNRFGEPVGKAGIAMGLDAAADLEALEQAWRAAYGADVRHSEVKFGRTDPLVPWYDAIQVDATSDNPRLVLWAMTGRNSCPGCREMPGQSPAPAEPTHWPCDGRMAGISRTSWG